MRINSVEFHNLKTGWHLVSSKLDVFNLLVGISGVGKTKIVQALCDLAIIATGATDTAYHLEWTLDFSHNDHDYLWKGRIEPSQIAQIRGARENEFTFEQIIVDRDTVLVERKNDTFNFKQSTLPKLKKSESAMVLLAEESSLADLPDSGCRWKYCPQMPFLLPRHCSFLQ